MADASGDVMYDVPANAVIPTCDANSLCTFAWGNYKFVVNAAYGARVIEYSLSGNNVLLTQAQAEGTAGDSSSYEDNFGGTFWPSPQNGTGGWGWPPIVAIDTGAFTVSIESNVLHLTSASFTIASGDPTMTAEKRFSVDSSTGVVTVQYTFNNTGTTSVSVAPWEISRVPAGALTFFPNPSATAITSDCNGGMAVPTTTTVDSYTFFVNVGSPQGKFCGNGGPKSYEAVISKGLLLVQAWPNVAGASFAPGEGNSEFYTDPSSVYEEVENQGPYVPIAGGGSSNWTVRWTLTSAASLTVPTANPTATSTTLQAIEAAADAQALLQ